MNRRRFLKVAGMGSLGGMVALLVAPLVAFTKDETETRISKVAPPIGDGWEELTATAWVKADTPVTLSIGIANDTATANAVDINSLLLRYGGYEDL